MVVMLSTLYSALLSVNGMLGMSFIYVWAVVPHVVPRVYGMVGMVQESILSRYNARKVRRQRRPRTSSDPQMLPQTKCYDRKV